MHPFEHLLPLPTHATPTDGALTLSGPVAAAGPDALMDALADLAFHGTDVRLRPGQAQPRVRVVEAPGAAPEWYRLTIEPERLTVETRDATGLARAAATLRQLMPDGVELPGTQPAVELPCGVIEDQPRHAWRGVLVDVARHYQPLPWLYRMVDLLAAYKFNVLHLHLTDDQGWRLEVPALPKLTEIGSWRSSTVYDGVDDGTPHGGFYTLAQLRDLDAYAARRGVNIVPEVDLPGHARALLAAYPEFGSGAELPVATEMRIHQEIIHITDESLAMMHSLIDVLLETFRSPWIHLGGDEAPTTEWEASPRAQEEIRRRGVAGPAELQHWLMRHFAGYLAERGRTLVGWDEIVEHQDLPDALVMAWRGSGPGHRAARRGHDVIMSPEDVVYLDRYHSDSPDEPRAWRQVTPWEKVAAWDPEAEWPSDATGRLHGVQAALWGEVGRNPEVLEFQAFPRLLVVAEVAWRGRADDALLRERLAAQLRRLQHQGVNVRPLEAPLPWQQGGTGWRRRVDRP